MKNKLIIITIIISSAFLLNTQLVNAQMGSMMNDQNTSTSSVNQDSGHTESIETILQELLTKQNVDTIQKLDCKKIGDDDLDHLGDAVMEQQHPGAAHEAMDRMMGGEGSESLRQMHINIGSSYLGCEGGYYNYNRDMMGGGMMRYGNNRYPKGQYPIMDHGSMMNYGNGLLGGYEYGILGVLTWIMLIIFLSAGTYFFIKQARKK
jgi:hypothetical protein